MSIFRRRVEIVSTTHDSGGEVRAALEDDFHHFRVCLQHEQGVLTAIAGEALRYPYTACPQSGAQLEQLLGMPLTRVAHSVTRQVDAQHQCTHLLDLAGLAIAAAARGTPWRRYDIQVPPRTVGCTRATLERDGAALLAWDVEGSLIQAPAPFSGVNLREGMARWALSNLPDEDAEAVLLLRRCTLIALGRAYNLDTQAHAVSSGRCYSQQPSRAEKALRMIGSTWDFSSAQAALCADDQVWLKQRSTAGTA
ncbi:DUF2889 domain-containing protein [Pseudomonas sp. UBA2684]|uniref:DUF2889 domain-containing protein n=1 Tax=Pseudomonas sp. UBA2684 TaxID=1947311 RepID=UPI000E982C29|nr:DUF2889 domain-containing protein [Pseudomonas sp. UBA2684]HBX55715.1 hypothetical protein [Pseudomonas sp.]|tara:strand:+ start:21125 stop:21880 length:756 start_codon:yes stop_codon:yes gene_type:complete